MARRGGVKDARAWCSLVRIRALMDPTLWDRPLALRLAFHCRPLVDGRHHSHTHPSTPPCHGGLVQCALGMHRKLAQMRSYGGGTATGAHSH